MMSWQPLMAFYRPIPKVPIPSRFKRDEISIAMLFFHFTVPHKYTGLKCLTNTALQAICA